MCMDGIPAFSVHTKSLKPLEYYNFSLPPDQRMKVQNILLHMLIPDDIKGKALQKYFDFAATFELNDLYYTGSSVLSVCNLSEDIPTRTKNRHQWCQS